MRSVVGTRATVAEYHLPVEKNKIHFYSRDGLLIENIDSIKAGHIRLKNPEKISQRSSGYGKRPPEYRIPMRKQAIPRTAQWHQCLRKKKSKITATKEGP